MQTGLKFKGPRLKMYLAKKKMGLQPGPPGLNYSVDPPLFTLHLSKGP